MQLPAVLFCIAPKSFHLIYPYPYHSRLTSVTYISRKRFRPYTVSFNKQICVFRGFTAFISSLCRLLIIDISKDAC